MSDFFPEAFTTEFGEREFILQPMSVTALRDNLSAIASEIVSINPKISISENCRYLRICNPNVTSEELIALCQEEEVWKLDWSYPLLAFHYKLPFETSLALLKKWERLNYSGIIDYFVLLKKGGARFGGPNATTIESMINAVSREDFESLIDDEYEFRSGWDSETLLPLFLARNENLSHIWKEEAPELYEWFTNLDSENLLEYVMSISYMQGGIGSDYWREYNTEILLTEFVRQQRNGYLQDPERFHFANWNYKVEKEFESYIYYVRDLEFNDTFDLFGHVKSEFQLGSALHLPDIFLEGIPNEAMFSVEGGNISITASISDDIYVDWNDRDSSSSDKLVGLQVLKGDGYLPVLPLYNVFGELEMIMVCLDYFGESIQEVIDRYLEPTRNPLEHECIPFYVGNVQCDGELIIGDAIWTENDNTLPSIQVRDMPIDDYGLIIYFDNSSFEATAICAVRGTTKRKFELRDAVFPEIKESSLKDGFARLLDVNH